MNEVWQLFMEWLRAQVDRVLFIASVTLDRLAIDNPIIRAQV